MKLETDMQITCRKVAVLSDIHSNSHALHACLADARQQGADAYIFLGDLVTGLAEPAETMALIHALRADFPTVCIRGNRERNLIDYHEGRTPLSRGSFTGSFLFTYDRLEPEDIDYLASLPASCTITVNSTVFELAHALKDHDRFYFDAASDSIGAAYAQMDADYLLTGHSHKQYTASAGGKTIINPGSVGLPQGGGWEAQYALLTAADGEAACELRRVPYDREALVHAQFSCGVMDFARYWALGDLYGALTGEEYTKMLLTKLFMREFDSPGAVQNEALWHRYAAELGMRFTEAEVLEALRSGTL